MKSSEKRPTLVSLFAGAGGLDLGLEQAGFETIFANEIEPYACESLRANRVLRSVSPAEFEGWFQQQVTEQRCYRSTPSLELSQLKRRLKAAVRDPVRYLERAHIEERDVRELPSSLILEATGKGVGEIDLIAGGPPCQPFSRSGKREMMECDTGQLFRDFVRLVTEIRPRFFLFENVKGLVIHKADVVSIVCTKCRKETLVDFAHRDALKEGHTAIGNCHACGHQGRFPVIWDKRRAGSLEIIEHEFARAGYSCQSIVLNAADFGAPQSRERLIIIGSRDNEKIQWPEPTHTDELAANQRIPTLFDNLRRPKKQWRTMNQVLYPTGHWQYGPLDPGKAVLWVKNVVRPHDEPVTWTLDRVAPTIGAHQSAKLAIAPRGVPEAQLKRQQWHVLGHRQGDTKPVPVEHEYLTDEELLRLQTFPTSWYLYGTRMQRAFQIGNAVPPVLGNAVGSSIIEAINQKEKADSGTRRRDEPRYATGI